MYAEIESRFLDAIRSDPNADAPRLAYADWLSGRGDPRGRFIQVQCELAQLGGDDEARRWELVAEEDELLEQNWAAWLAAIDDVTLTCHFCRGFVEVVRLQVKHPQEQLQALFASPVVSVPRDLNLINCDDELFRQLVEQSWALTWTDSLSIQKAEGNQISAAGLSALIEIPSLPRLIRLYLCENNLGDEGLINLAQSAQLTNLRKLSLLSTTTGDDGLIALANSPYLRSICDLDLRQNKIGDRGVAVLAHSPNLAPLRTFWVDNNEITSASFVPFVRSPYFQVAELYVRYNGLDDQCMAALAESPQSQSLRVLSIGENDLISEEGFEALAASPYLSQLRELTIWMGYAVDSETQAQVALANATGLTSLETLAMNQLTEEAGWAFVHTQRLPKLRILDCCSSTSLSDEVVAALKQRYEEFSR